MKQEPSEKGIPVIYGGEDVKMKPPRPMGEDEAVVARAGFEPATSGL